MYCISEFVTVPLVHTLHALESCSFAKALAMNDLYSKLPTERTEEALQKRRELFDSMDPNGNGYLSLAEIDKGCQELGLHDLFDAKPVLMRAYQSARSKNDAKNADGTDYVERSEFRLLLVYLKLYMQLYGIFARVDKDGDHRLSVEEVQSADLSSLGIQDAANAFEEMDINEGGKVLFDEFAEWAIRKQLVKEEDYE